MEHRSVRLQGLFGVPASVRKGGKMKKKKNKKVETLRVPLHTYTYIRMHMREPTQIYQHPYTHTHTHVYIYIFTSHVSKGKAFFSARLSRQRFILRSHKTNGKIVSKILTAHLGEHVPAARRYSTTAQLLQRIKRRRVKRRQGQGMGVVKKGVALS